LVVPAFGFADGVDGERFELGDQVFELAVVVEPVPVAVDLFGR
jgi:hypothetical protein